MKTDAHLNHCWAIPISLSYKVLACFCWCWHAVSVLLRLWHGRCWQEGFLALYGFHDQHGVVYDSCLSATNQTTICWLTIWCILQTKWVWVHQALIFVCGICKVCRLVFKMRAYKNAFFTFVCNILSMLFTCDLPFSLKLNLKWFSMFTSAIFWNIFTIFSLLRLYTLWKCIQLILY